MMRFGVDQKVITERVMIDVFIIPGVLSSVKQTSLLTTARERFTTMPHLTTGLSWKQGFINDTSVNC